MLLGAWLGSIVAPANAFQDSPDYLMLKALAMGISPVGHWQIHCHWWHPESKTEYFARCPRLHKRIGSGPHTHRFSGHGGIYLVNKYGLVYWSYEYVWTERWCSPTAEFIHVPGAEIERCEPQHFTERHGRSREYLLLLH